MTSSPAAPLGDHAGFQFRLGPMPIGVGPGADARRGAARISDALVSRGFDAPWMPTEELARERLDRFPHMIVVAPSERPAGSDITAILRPTENLAIGYRGLRRDGIVAWRAGLVPARNIGVLTFIATPDVLADPAAKTLRDLACASHELQVASGDPSCIFEVYDREIFDLTNAMNPLEYSQALQLWHEVRKYGLQHISQVDLVLKRIDQLRDYYETDAKPRLRRPRNDIPRSRLAFLLDEPYEPPGEMQKSARNAWNADGAAVIRHVIEELKMIVPTFANPQRSRGSNDRFGRLYGDLRCLSLFLKLTAGASDMDFPNE